MKKKIGLICILAFTGLLSVHAQNNITVHDERTNKDEVIELPEGMTSDIDSLLNEWHIKNYLSEDEGCESSSENPTFPEEVYISRLSRLPNIIEMPYNEVVRKFIDHYGTKLRRSVSYMLGAANFYIPIFEEAAGYHCLTRISPQTTDLALYSCGTQKCPPGHSFGPAARPEYHLHVVMDGAGCFQVHGQTWHLKHRLCHCPWNWTTS